MWVMRHPVKMKKKKKKNEAVIGMTEETEKRRKAQQPPFSLFLHVQSHTSSIREIGWIT